MKYRIKGSFKKSYGGSSGVTTVDNIPDWARPYVENVAQATESAYGAGELGKVAGPTTLQQQAFTKGADAITLAGERGQNLLEEQSKRLSENAAKGAYDTKALKDAAILEAGMATAKLGQDYGSRGVLGSARQAVHQGAQDAMTAAQFAKIDQDAAQKAFENKMLSEKGLSESVGMGSKLASETASGLAKLGSEQRGIEQQGLDATWQALQRYASTIYGNPSRQQAVGGGK